MYADKASIKVVLSAKTRVNPGIVRYAIIGNRLLTTSSQDTQDKVILRIQNEELFVFQKTGNAKNPVYPC
jgi:hypothetical protein